MSCGRSTMCRSRSTTATSWAFSAITAPANRPCCAYLPESISRATGSISIEGRVSPLFTTSPGLVADDTGYENIVTCGLLLGMTRDEIERKLPEIEAFTELSDYLALPVRTYSSGMLVRLGFAIATAIDPEILLLDEGLGAGDARFAARAAEPREGADRKIEHHGAGLSFGQTHPPDVQARDLARPRPDHRRRADRGGARNLRAREQGRAAVEAAAGGASRGASSKRQASLRLRSEHASRTGRNRNSRRVTAVIDTGTRNIERER